MLTKFRDSITSGLFYQEKVKQGLAKASLKFNGGLAKPGFTFLVN